MTSSVEIKLLARAIIEAMPQQDNILTDQRVAEILDKPVTEIQKMCRRGEIPATKLKGKWYISERRLKASLFGEG